METNFPDHYTIIPSTFLPGIPGSFLLSIHSSEKIFSKALSPRERWHEALVEGEWKAETAGGCRNHPSWENNPQFELAATSVGQEKLLVVLSQEADSAMVAIGFYVISCNSGQIVGKGAFMVAPEVHCEVEAIGTDGPYIIVPCTFEPYIEAKFVLAVYSKNAVSLAQCS